MTVNYIPLDKEKHKDLKINLKHNFEHTKDSHLAAATLREYGQLASCMPIVFIKGPDEANVTYHSVALLGIEQNVNLYWTEEKWLGHAIPLNMQRYPFDVRADGDKLGVFIDENSALVGDTGEAVFTDAGEPSEFLVNRQTLLSDLANSEMATQRFIAKVIELDLVVPLEVRVTNQNGQQRNVTGMFSISERRVNNLTDEQVVELQKAGYLGAIYAILMSLGQLNRLVQLTATTENPIANMQLNLVDPAEGEEEKATEEAKA